MPDLAMIDGWMASALFIKFALTLCVLFSGGLLLQHLALERFGPVMAIGRQAGICSAFAALFFMGAYVLVMAGQMGDAGLMGMFDWEMLSLLMQGPLLMAFGLKAVGLCLLIIAFWRWQPAPLLALGAVLLLALSFVMMGHSTYAPRFVLGPLICLHVLIAMFWFGGLFVLYASLTSKAARTETAALVRRFGEIAFILVPLLVIAGGLFAFLILGGLKGGIGALFTSAYGAVLLVKIFVVSILLALAGLNKLRLTPRLEQGEAAARRHLVASIGFEIVCFLLIIALTGLLTGAVSLPEGA